MKTHLNLDECRAYEALLRAARTSPMLTGDELAHTDRIARFHLRIADLEIAYATERLVEAQLDLLQELVDEQEIIAQFEAMSEGEPMNFIEGFGRPRPALHLWNRNFDTDDEDVPSETAVSKAMVARELHRVAGFLRQLDRGQLVNHRGQPINAFVQIGIGGSELGPKAVVQALKPFHRANREVDFVSNIDPDHVQSVLGTLDLDRTLFAVASKSGSTLETRENAAAISSRLRAAGLTPRDHMISITTPGSAIDDDERFRQRFLMLPDVGGRFSVSSPVGLISLGFICGTQAIESFLAGAAAIDQATFRTRITDNPSLLLAALSVWNRNFLGIPSHAILPYCHGLSEFVAHLQQVAMESNGKSINRYGKDLAYATAPVIWGACGTNSQHSFFQQLHQGNLLASCTFLGFRRPQVESVTEDWPAENHHHLNTNMIAQCIALALGQSHTNPNQRFPGNRPSHMIVGTRLDPRTVGALLALFENKTVLEGFMWNINSFDQEGVQLGKRLAGSLSADTRDETDSPDPMVQAGHRLMDALRF